MKEGLTKQQGIAHVEKVFDRYMEWVLADATAYKSALLKSILAIKQEDKQPASYYTKMAIEGMQRNLARFINECGKTILHIGVNDIMSEE